jgi:outer membrane receptor protein involved in Fe transport
MSTPLRLASLLLVSTALAPAIAYAQSTPTAPDSPPQSAGQTQADDQQTTPQPGAQPEEQTAPDVSIPGGGGDIVIVGRTSKNIIRSTSEVVSVLSSADIARTGEGDIAGALSRVTGLSVVGNGFVYVRGLGDRYSLALLNGSPLPSPEPLKRVVPLDLFPTSVIASSLVQKTYSPNFPGEFGGGVINLTTKAIPKESFLTIGGNGGINTETTGKLGYVYFGSNSDWTGFDDGSRNTPPALQAFFKSGKRINDVDSIPIAQQLVRPQNALLQRNTQLPPNWSASISGGTSTDIGDVRLGVIATASITNKWQTRDTRQQTPSTLDLSRKELDFERVITDNRVTVNGLLGFGLEFGESKIRWTNLYIRDTLKQARLGLGSEATTGFTRMDQDTAWYERQLIDTQIVGEFKLGDLELDLRGGYANTQREAPYELSFGYIRSNRPNDLLGQYFVNQLNNGNNGSASAAFSNLNENLRSAGVDLTYAVTSDIKVTAGYAFSDTTRYSERREFVFVAPPTTPTGGPFTPGGLPTTLPQGVTLLRPDLLLQPANIKAFNIRLQENTETDPAFNAGLRVHGGYVQFRANFTPEIELTGGVRYENGRQFVNPAQVFTVPSNSGASTLLKKDYWLPAATLTYKITPEMQVRVNASKTLARPQFRELIFQQYYDPDTNRQYRGNPFLIDSQLYNAEARFEWYFAREQRFTLAGFYKRIDHPIEAFTGFNDNTPTTSFANAPKANLYGVEAELTKYFDLSSWGGGFFDTRRLITIANYTFTKSKLKVGTDDIVNVFGTTPQPATNFFRDGSPLTGQSDHLVNFQVGLEDTVGLSQQTFLLTYASKRVTSRGAAGLPDIIEYPGFRLDFVAREGIKIAGIETEIKFEVRNITNTKYQEYQQVGSNRNYYNLYNVGTSATLGASVTF